MKRYPSMPMFRKALGNALRSKRKAHHLSQEELAERLDLHRNYISLVERGIQNITLETLFKLAIALDCSPVDLFTDMAPLSDAPSPDHRAAEDP